MFTNIVDPKSKKSVSIFSQEGGNLLSHYVNVYKKIRTVQEINNKTNTKNKNKNNKNE